MLVNQCKKDRSVFLSHNSLNLTLRSIIDLNRYVLLSLFSKPQKMLLGLHRPKSAEDLKPYLVSRLVDTTHTIVNRDLDEVPTPHLSLPIITNTFLRYETKEPDHHSSSLSILLPRLTLFRRLRCFWASDPSSRVSDKWPKDINLRVYRIYTRIAR